MAEQSLISFSLDETLVKEHLTHFDYDAKNNKIIINENHLYFIRSFVKKIPAGIAIFDRKMNYIAVSERWCKDLKLKKKDIIGRNHYDLFSDIPEKWLKVHQRCFQGEYLKSYGDVYNRDDGTTEWLRWECFPWYTEEDQIGGIVILFELLTEKNLIKMEMERTIQTLNNSNKELGRFAHMCAHDLSEPLRTISNYIQLIEQSGLDKLNHDMQVYLNSILTNAKYMHTLICDSLQYTEMNAWKIKKKNVQLEEVVVNIQTIFEKAFQDKSVVLQYDTLPIVVADEVLLTRVFQNLISNALKFNTHQPPIITIKAEDIKNAWLISIEDNGIGIHPNYHAKIFDLFERLHAKSKYSGSGMGLSLCKKIVEAHYGKIWVQSALNQGSTFFFTLPHP